MFGAEQLHTTLFQMFSFQPLFHGALILNAKSASPPTRGSYRASPAEGEMSLSDLFRVLTFSV